MENGRNCNGHEDVDDCTNKQNTPALPKFNLQCKLMIEIMLRYQWTKNRNNSALAKVQFVDSILFRTRKTNMGFYYLIQIKID